MPQQRHTVYRAQRRASLLSAVIWLTVLVAGSPFAGAQDPAEDGILAGRLDPEEIAERMNEIRSDQDISEDLRSELLSFCEEALTHVERTATLTAQAEQFSNRRAAVPDELERLKREIKDLRAQAAAPIPPTPPPGATLEQLTAELTRTEAEARGLRQALEALKSEEANRNTRIANIPQELVDTTAKLQEIDRDLSGLSTSAADDRLIRARRGVLDARRKAGTRKVRALEEELAHARASRDLLAAQLTRGELALRSTESMAKAWRALVQRWRQDEIQQQEQRAEALLAQVPESIRELVEENSSLAAERAELAEKLKGTGSELQSTKAIAEQFDAELKDMQEFVQAAGSAKLFGPRLVKRRRELPQTTSHHRRLRLLKSDIVRARVRELELRGQIRELGDIGQRVAAVVAETGPAKDPAQQREIEDAVRRILTNRRGALEALQGEYDEYWRRMVNLRIALRALIGDIEGLRGFIDENVLWVPNLAPLKRTHWPKSITPQPDTWPTLGRAIREDVLLHPAVYALTLAGCLGWVALFPRCRRRRRWIYDRVTHPYSDSFALTLEGVGWDLFMALPLPAVMWFTGSRLHAAAPTDDLKIYTFALALAAGCLQPAFSTLAILWLRSTCRRHGVAQAHLQWHPDTVAGMRRAATLLLFVVIPAMAANFARIHPDSAWLDGVSRVVYPLILIVVALFFFKLARIGSRAVARQERWRSRPFLSLLSVLAQAAALLIPTLLIVLVIVGFGHAAFVVLRATFFTVLLGVGLVVLRGLILRGLQRSQQAAAIRQAKEAMKNEGTQAADEAVATELPPPPDSFRSASESVRLLLRWVLIFTFGIGLWGIWQDIVPAFKFTNRIELWNRTVEVAVSSGEGDGSQIVEKRVAPVNLAALLLAIFIAGFTVVLVANAPAVMETVVLRQMPIDAGARFAIAAVTRYVLIIVGMILAFEQIGIGWSQVQWLAAAITVGVGFGLQEIVANFVSGLVILFERPIRLGDVVTVGDTDGRVARINMRATTIIDWNNRELIVPNKDFITTRIVNWSLSESMTRVDVPVGIAYGSDTDLARDLLQQVARSCPHVMTEPAPVAVFLSFGSSSLDFELRVYIRTRDVWPALMDDLHSRIDKEFRRAGIEIAFPQRDIHIRSIDAQVGQLTEAAEQFTAPTQVGRE